ncbi:hypothetical protein JCM10207_005828 [Rhodosporidiobolus poonsookiae]
MLVRPPAPRRLPVPSTRSLSFFSPSSSPSPPPSRPDPQHRDLVIVGGGPAGLSLAAALAASPPLASTHSITLLEGFSLNPTRNWTPTPGAYSNRVSSITNDNAAFLRQAGIWQHLDQSRLRPVEQMQVWDGLSSARIDFTAPFLPASSSSSSSEPPSPFPLSSRGSMSTLLENLNLQRAALRRIEQLNASGEARVEIVEGRRVASIEEGEGGWPVVRMEEGKEGGEEVALRARLLIGADGYSSPVKAFSSIETFGWAYDRHGVVATLKINPLDAGGVSGLEEKMRTAWQRFLPTGPIAFLPLSDTHASLVWSTTPHNASLLKALPLSVLPLLIDAAFTLPYAQLADFLSALPPPPPSSPSSSSAEPQPSPYDATTLTSHLQSLLLAHSRATYDPSSPPPLLPPSVLSVQTGSVASFPLRLSHTSSYLGQPRTSSSPEGVSVTRDARTVLVGDAAHTVHPLAGQGLNMGLGDAQKLVEVLTEVAEKGGDAGAYLSLLAYPRARYAANHALLSTCDHLHQLYSSSNPALVWARSTGVEVLNELEGVKSWVMRRAGAGSAGGEGGRERHGGAWETVAEGLEKATQLRSVAGAVVSGVVGAVGKRMGEFVVKGR